MDTLLIGQLSIGALGLGVGLLIGILAVPPRKIKVPAPAVAPVTAPSISLDGVAATTEAEYKAVMKKGVGAFQSELAETSGQINEQLKRLSADVISQELERLQEEISSMRERSAKAAAAAEAAIESERQAAQQSIQADRKAQAEAMKEALAKQQADLAERLDLELGQAVTAYLVDSLGVDVDLGAQGPSLVKLVTDHADELKATLS